MSISDCRVTGERDVTALRIGAKVPHSGPLPGRFGVGAMASSLEQAGFESLWVSDHVVLPTTIESSYPFVADGRATWATDIPYLEAMVALAVIAEATRSATIGTAVLVLPLRQPVVLAKQIASIDAISNGRFRLGVGAGWLREEFEALEVPLATRGQRFVEWIDILRRCWTGAPEPFTGTHYTLPPGVLCLPAPAAPIPVLIGGHSPTALRRAGQLGQGWLGQQSVDALDTDEIARAVQQVHAAAETAGRDTSTLSVVLRLVDSAGRSCEVAGRLPALVRAGVDEIIVDVSWDDDRDPGAEYRQLRAAVSGG